MLNKSINLIGEEIFKLLKDVFKCFRNLYILSTDVLTTNHSHPLIKIMSLKINPVLIAPSIRKS